MVDRTASLKEQSTKDEENTAAWTNARKARERAVAKFLINEGGRARAADAKAKVFIAGFKASYIILRIDYSYKYLYICVYAFFFLYNSAVLLVRGVPSSHLARINHSTFILFFLIHG